MEKAGRIISQPAGFAAAQSLIAAAIVAATAVVLMGILGNIADMSSKYIVKEEITSAAQAVQQVLLQEDLCQIAIRGTAGADVTFDGTTAVNVAAINSPDLANPGLTPKPVVTSNSPYVSSFTATRITIGQMQLRQVTAGAAALTEQVWNVGVPAPVPYRTFIAQLVIPSAAGNIFTNAKQLPNQTICIKLFVDAGNVVRKCFSLSSDNQTCRSLGGTITNGRCILPVCNVNFPVDPPPPEPQVHYPCPPMDPSRTCINIPGTNPPSQQLWMWVFSGGVVTPAAPSPPNRLDPSRPKCVCLQSCT